MAPSWKVSRNVFETSGGDYAVEVSKAATPAGSYATIKVQYHELILDSGRESFYEESITWRKGRAIPSRTRLERLLDSANVPFYVARNCAVDLVSDALSHIFKDHALHVVRLGSLRRSCRRRPSTLRLPSVVVSVSCLQSCISQCWDGAMRTLEEFINDQFQCGIQGCSEEDKYMEDCAQEDPEEDIEEDPEEDIEEDLVEEQEEDPEEDAEEDPEEDTYMEDYAQEEIEEDLEEEDPEEDLEEDLQEEIEEDLEEEDPEEDPKEEIEEDPEEDLEEDLEEDPQEEIEENLEEDLKEEIEEDPEEDPEEDLEEEDPEEDLEEDSKEEIEEDIEEEDLEEGF